MGAAFATGRKIKCGGNKNNLFKKTIMTNASKFEFFQKHKVDGLQNIMGGYGNTTLCEKTRQYSGIDAWFTPEESHTSYSINPQTKEKGDLVKYTGIAGDPDQNTDPNLIPDEDWCTDPDAVFTYA